MKQLLLSILLLALPMVANADPVEIGGIYYNLIQKARTAEVTINPNKYSGIIVIPEKVNYEGIPYDVIAIGLNAFKDCSNMKSIAIPPSVKTIIDSAFLGCKGLLSVHISDLSGWCSIDFKDQASNPLAYAHRLYLNGEEIHDLIIPDDITYIKPYSFYQFTGMTSVTIHNNVSRIGYGAFKYCSGLTSVIIPNSVTAIEESTFEECTSLKSVSIPNSVTEIRGNAFLKCTSLTTITIPNSVKTIYNCVFDGCTNLASIVIPNSVTMIYGGAFEGCTGLNSITLSSNITSIDSYTFYKCSNLKSVNIPNSVETIGNNSFSNCSSIKEITIPNSVRLIRGEAFKNCMELTDVYCYAENTPRLDGTDIFDGSYIEYATLHVPAASIESYSSTSPWSSFGTIVAIDEPSTGGITTEVINIPSRAVLTQNSGGVLSISGLDAGMVINVYSISGAMVGSATASAGVTTVSTSLSSGDIAIVKIGGKSIKVLLQ